MSLTLISETNKTFYSPDVSIVETKFCHIKELRDSIREMDRKEVEALGYSCAKALWRSYKSGIVNKTLLVDGKVAAIFGCSGTPMGETGAPWLLTGKEMSKISPLKFVRLYQTEMYRMLDLFPRLENFCLDGYDEALRLLQICGFTIDMPQKIGNGLFRKFTIERKI